MGFLFTILVFAVVFSLLILGHEFGHFIVAKLSGIKVEEFGIGFPPRIWGKKKGETVYSINAIPFGGFVRLFGMDGIKKGKDSARSFESKSIRSRALVMLGGVIMNLLIAWVSLTGGFVAGIEPLLGPEDVLPAVSSGVVKLQDGAVIKSVEDGSFADIVGFEVGDSIKKIDSVPVLSDAQLDAIKSDPSGVYEVIRNNEKILLSGIASDSGVSFGAEFKDAMLFPRVRILDVDFDSNAYKSGLRGSDVVIALDTKPIYSLEQYREILESSDSVKFTVSRDGVYVDVIVETLNQRKVVISDLISDGPAMKAGILPGDLIVSVDGRKFYSPERFVKYISENVSSDPFVFEVLRAGEKMFFEINAEDGKVGVYLSPLLEAYGEEGISVYIIDQFTSVVSVASQKVPFYKAPFVAFSEMWKLFTLTGDMFVDFVKQLVGTGEIPENVSGPVGIAEMAGASARQGFMSLVRFVAILSIGLAVVNIFPFPGLDGGKLLFLLVEFIIGRRVSMKWEGRIHVVGYLLLIILAIAVTFNDIVRLLG